jgi:peroxiredoxin family protein
MNRVVIVFTFIGVVLLGSQALAADEAGQSKMSKRQMVAEVVSCMKKRMSADRNTSYNEAMKACKDQVNRENDTLAAGALVASDHPAKP